MITLSQIEDLKTAHERGTLSVEILIKKWEAELFEAESKKAGKITFSLKNLKEDVTKTIVGIDMGGGYAFHKDAWGGSFYVLTYVETETKIFTGKKTDLMPVIKAFQTWAHKEEFTAALKLHGIKALRALTDAQVIEYRKMYEQAMGRE